MVLKKKKKGKKKGKCVVQGPLQGPFMRRWSVVRKVTPVTFSQAAHTALLPAPGTQNSSTHLYFSHCHMQVTPNSHSSPQRGLDVSTSPTLPSESSRDSEKFNAKLIFQLSGHS